MTTWPSTTPIPNPSNAWTDGTITANSTNVKLAHLIELREFLEGVDGHYHIFDGETSGSNPDIDTDWAVATDSMSVNVTLVAASHWQELRTALEQLGNHTHTAKGYTSTDKQITTAWAEDIPLTADVDWPKKTHIDELRAACNILANHTHTVCCDSECGCVGHCGGYCGENCCSQCWYFD